MSEYEEAVAAFLEKNTVQVVEPILDAKKAKQVAIESYHNYKEREAEKNDRYDATVRNAENRRYDSEGVYYIGGRV